MRKILFDTNAYTRFLTGDQWVLDELSLADIVYMPVIVLGELYTGFEGGEKKVENKRLLEKFLDKPPVQVAYLTKETAEIFGEIKNRLKQEGKPIPINDIWIAACAIETGSVLISYDKHFLNIAGLRIWNVLKPD